ncbi:hybrid sensor histidine kinase/response regulator transcription factor [Alistipes sp.]|uniref:hybrid sensor histidine kinase/response regulator transcription factor n=1 Tax=Alistipes sp. TaxID=1872444 RepID=UPI003AF12EA1
MKRNLFPNRILVLLTALLPATATVRANTPTDTVAETRRLHFGHLSVSDGLSQMSVVSIIQDGAGFLWLGTRDGLNRYDGYGFRVFRHELHDTLSLSDNYIRCMVRDRGEGLWIGTTNGLNRYDPRSGNFTRCYVDRTRHTGNVNEINALCTDPAGGVWLGTYNGLYRIDDVEREPQRVDSLPQRIYSLAYCDSLLYVGHDRGLATLSASGTLHHLIRDDRSRAVNLIYPDSAGLIHFSYANTGTLAMLDPRTGEMLERTIIAAAPERRDNLIRSIAEQPGGRLVLGTYDGLRIYDPATGLTESYNQTPQEEGGLSHYAVETVYIDRAGTLWAGTYAGGVNYAHAQREMFSHYDPRQSGHLPGVLSALVADPGGDALWIGTDAGGVLRFDTRSKRFDHYPCTPIAGDLYKDNNVKTLLLADEILYAGLYTGQLHSLNTRTRRWTETWHNPDHTAIYALARMRDTLLLGTYSAHGLKYLATDGIRDRDLVSNDGRTLNINQISALHSMPDGELWIGTRSRGLYRYRPSGELIRYTSDDGNSIWGNRITTISADSRGRILAGTSDGGLNIYDPAADRFTTVTHREGLHDNTVCSAVEDRQGRIWVITRTGISELDAGNRVRRTYDHSSGLRVQEFSPASALVSDDNTIWVGGDNYLVSFNPDRIKANTYVPPVVITSVHVNNRPFDGEYPAGKGLRLAHDRNNLSFAFSALNYVYPERNAYCYKLDGADNEWRSAGSNREVNYANLAPGRYLFRVRGSNNDGIWNPEEATLAIEILPPLWLRWWAWLLYALLFGTAARLVLRHARERHRLRRHVLIKQKEEELYKARIDLFTSFAHELRTPLTLILSPLEEMLSADNPLPPTREGLRMIEANARRMLLLINQLMDLRRKESGTMTVRVAEGDFAGFTEEIFIAFNHQARQHRIDYRFQSAQRPLMLWYDRWLFEKVVLNLLSNAFKFTQDGGRITLCTELVDRSALPDVVLHDKEFYAEAEQYLHLGLTDDGIGMDAHDLERIFDPFYQVRESSFGRMGTGIGLSLVKGIVGMHRGAIRAESTPAGGSTFHVYLPTGHAHFRPDQIITNYRDSEALERYAEEPSEESDAPVRLPEKRSDALVLIVEDNRPLRTYIRRSLSPYWRVIEAENGRSGRLLALEKMPSLIISDVMMPVMNGLEMCHALKHDPRTAHIPVVLLTARQFVLQMKEGLEFGADDYITKPFHMRALILKVRNIISSRERLKELYGQRLSLENLGVEIDTDDDKFLQQLTEAIDRDIADPALNLDALCQRIGMSRASLYRKLTAATGLSPARYIQSVRLNLAARLLRRTDMSVSEVATASGFNSLVHFSAAFRKQYGVAPSRYAAEKAGETAPNGENEPQE